MPSFNNFLFGAVANPSFGSNSGQGYDVSANAFLQPNQYSNELTYAINKDNQLFNTNSATIAYERQKELDDLSRDWTSNENSLAFDRQMQLLKANQDWQNSANKAAMDFEKSERLAKQAYDTEMSNTAIQRQVADLKAAGLNPILAATTLGGASSPSGATGSGYANGAGVSGVSSLGASRGSVNTAHSNSLTASSVYNIGDLARAVLNSASQISSAAFYTGAFNKTPAKNRIGFY